ncbi:response regulator [Evansella sp. AB-P1]|uniref:response regulator transcription factor n=1 Tax=Evansella sp. AB-P1 TaxID=3037653 RepID=UPI00241DAF91|nr:response regulator [Evansella sp. AB-P1]MDG5785987.1 response regulator [Evansella sp. AB-P1]
MYDILLVEDERWVRTAIRKVIEKTGLPFRVVMEATNGMEALNWLQIHTVSLIVTDIRMPLMDGLALTKYIREKDIRSDIIIVSGHDEFNYAQQAIQSGVFNYLLKPVEHKDMEDCLKKWMELKEDHKEVRTEEEINEELSSIEQVIRIIRQATPGSISLKEAANQVHLNASYLSQLFKEQTGKNFNEYAKEVRMSEAKNLLLRTSLRISEVAERLGYSDLAYFTNSFKKFYGTTPSKYRNDNK